MSATSHEAPYVLDGLMHHGTALRIGTHYTDTGGASDHLFILCAMLGIRFCPRLRDFPTASSPASSPRPSTRSCSRCSGGASEPIIREYWDEVLRLVASLQAGTVLPSAMLKRLQSSSARPSSTCAFPVFGRIERTLFMLDSLRIPGGSGSFAMPA